MNATATATKYTPEDLLVLPDEDRYELVNGQLVERHMSSVSSYIGGKLFCRLFGYCDPRQLGWVWHADNGFQCFPHAPKLVRKPEIAFIQRGRLPKIEMATGYETLAPDLIAEVVSPNDEAYDIERRIDDYLRAGVRLVWVLYPETRTVHVFRPNGSAQRLRESDELSGEDVVPDFRCALGELFAIPESANGSPA